MDRAIGITIHTGWAACVVVGGSLRKPEVANKVIELLEDAGLAATRIITAIQRIGARSSFHDPVRRVTGE